MSHQILKDRAARVGLLKTVLTAGAILAVVIAPLMLSAYVNFQLSMIAVFAVAILGLNVLMGYAGQISLGQSAFVGLGAYVTGFGIQRGWSPVIVFLLACAIPAVVGLIVAIPAARLKGYAIAMVTISLPIIGIPLVKRFPEITGGTFGLTVSWMTSPEWTGLDDDQWRFYVIVAIAALLFVLARNLVRGRVGRAFAIVRDNEAVATSMGVSSYRYKVIAFTIAALYGGAAGFLYLVAVQFVSPESLSFVVSINLLAALVIGGTASVLGSLIGGVFYVLIPYLAGQVNSTQTAIFSGAALLVVLFIVPGGLITVPSTVKRLVAKYRATRNRGVPPGAHTQAGHYLEGGTHNDVGFSVQP